MLEQRYISAYYDFYFVLETLYGNGKPHNHAVKAEFKKSPRLMTAARGSLDFSEDNFGSQQTREAFIKRFQNHTVESLLDHIVDQRGFLHHHTARRPNVWHPAHEDEYEIDALLLQDIACRVLVAELYEMLKADPRTMADRMAITAKSTPA